MIRLKPIKKLSGLTPQNFEAQYLTPEVPVIFTDLMDDWSAKEKWSLNFFKENYGHLQVPVFSSNTSKPGKKYMEPDQIMPLRDYIESIQNGATDLRLFLYNIFDHAPELQKDYQVPEIMKGFYKEFPFTFFGSGGSKVPMHYDIDMSHVFLSQFEGRKKVILFSHEQSKNLYHLPFTVASYVDVDRPDFEKYPALSKVTGYECMLNPGDTLFIPSGFWHYITYTDPGFSMSQRANDSIVKKVQGAANIASHFVIDRGMNQLLGERWRKIKESMAIRRAELV